MGGMRWIAVGWLAIALGSVLGTMPAAANDTYGVSSYPYSADATIGAYEEFDSHEIIAVAGKEIKYTARATGGGCVIGILALGHNFDFNTSLYLPRASQETCVASFSKTYTVPSGGGPDFSIVITSEIIQDVDYHVDISVANPSPWGAVAGILGFIVIAAIIGGITYAIRRRKAARAPPPYVPPPYPAEYPAQVPAQPPAQPPMQPPMEPGAPPPPPAQ